MVISSAAQKIKEALSIEEVISSYLKLERSGVNFKAKCPFHNEKTPSFFVSTSRGSYYCFGCGAKGDIFTFVEEFEGLDFRGALEILARRAGIPLESYNPKDQSEKERLYKVMEEAASYFVSNLSKTEDVLKYLHKRGLEDKSIKEFRIGYANPNWRELLEYLSKKNFSNQEMEKAGLIKAGDKGYYDRFRGRIMFPIMDSSGRVIAFSGRIFVEDEKSAKYLNSPDTPLYNKSAVLYGLDKAKESIRKNNFSILVEGQMDLVLSHQAGYRNTIATSGTALTDLTVSKENIVSNLGLVRRLSENIVLAFDGDRAGFEAANRAARIALSLGMDVKVAFLGEGVDPADLIKNDGKDKWKEAIRNSTHIIEFVLGKIIKTEPDLRKAGRLIREKVLPFVDALESSIEKSHFLKKISDVTSIPIEALEEDLRNIQKELKYENKEIKDKLEPRDKTYRKDYILKRLLGIVLWQKTLSKSSIEIEKVLKEVAEILKLKTDEVLNKDELDKEDLIFQAEVFYGKEVNLKKDVEELLDNLKEEQLREELALKMKELHQAEEDKQTEKSLQILKNISDINNQIQNIKNKRLSK